MFQKIISVSLIVQTCTNNTKNKILSYSNSNISVIDCICTDARLEVTPNNSVYTGEVKINTLDGQVSGEWFTIDEYTVSQNKAIGYQMLLVKFGNEEHLLFTDAMLGK